MKFKDIITDYIPRGELIRNEDMYQEQGIIPVFSAQTTGPFGYYDKANYKTTNNTFLFSVDGVNAGYVSIFTPNTDIWLTSVCGVLELNNSFIEKYPKEILAIWLQNFFIKNRHNNGTQPKFSILKILDKEINISELEMLHKMDLSFLSIEDEISVAIKNINIINNTDGKNTIKLKDFIEDYLERGTRLVKGRDLYINHGEVKVMSATTTGPTGYYNQSNFYLKENDFLYAIDGYAGYVSILKPQKIFLTDHAGIITIPEKTIQKYGKVAIALFLQDYFIKNRTSTGNQPTFMLKNILELELDLDKLQILAERNLDQFIK